MSSREIDNGYLDVCISVVSGNDPHIARACLDSLRISLEGRLKVEIHFVDNASPENWFAGVQGLSDKIRVHRNIARKGFAANHNSIISQVRARYYLLLNDDTYVYPSCVERLVEAAECSQNVGFVGPKLLNPDGSVQASVYRFPSPNLAFTELFFLRSLHRMFPSLDDYRTFSYDESKIVDYLSGAALLVKREVCDGVGLLDEQFFMYSEETDWCMRANKAGWSALFTPAARVMHHGGHSTVDHRPARSVEFLRSHEKLIKKHFGTSGLMSYKFMNLLKHAPRAAISVIAKWPSQRQMSERDTVLWSLGLLRRQGLSELAANHYIHKDKPLRLL